MWLLPSMGQSKADEQVIQTCRDMGMCQTVDIGKAHKTICEMVVSFCFSFLFCHNDLVRALHG